MIWEKLNCVPWSTNKHCSVWVGNKRVRNVNKIFINHKRNSLCLEIFQQMYLNKTWKSFIFSFYRHFIWIILHKKNGDIKNIFKVTTAMITMSYILGVLLVQLRDLTSLVPFSITHFATSLRFSQTTHTFVLESRSGRVHLDIILHSQMVYVSCEITNI